MSDISELKTVVIKHLPAECTDEECRQFLTSLGAISVTFMGHRGPLKHCAFAEFTSNEHAWKIIEGLHQKMLFGKRIAVEFCKESREPFIQYKETPCSPEIVKETSPKHTKRFCLCEFSPVWDRTLHVPSNLLYRYPPPTDKILTNVVRALVSCSAFYTQVLHLMNRMHLPPPFDDPDLFPGTHLVVSDKEVIKNDHLADNLNRKARADDSTEEYIELQEMDLSSGTESELDSDETEKVQRKPSITRRKYIRTNLPITRLSSVRTTNSRKSSSTAKKATDLADLFESTSKPKKPSLHIPQTIKLIDPLHEKTELQSIEGGFGIIAPPIASVDEEHMLEVSEQFKLRKSPRHNSSLPPHRKNMDSCQTNTTSPTNLSLEVNTITTFSLNELREGCLTAEDRNKYTVFARGYNPGEPTSRLYVKNLATLVQESDLFQIYGLFANGVVLDPNEKLQIPLESSFGFSVRLLTEGRMKGQAFISLPCESTAKQALEVTNGFMLFDKPMVVQFARGAKAKVDDKSLILSQPES